MDKQGIQDKSSQKQEQPYDFVKMTRERLNQDPSLTPKQIVANLPIQKNFLKNHQSQYTKEQINLFRHQNEIIIKSDHNLVPDPFLEWTDFEFPSYIKDQITKLNFNTPTAIQSQAFPTILQGRDFIGIAQTGSGKTIAFLLPGLIHMRAQPRASKGDGPIMLVLAPTRELAMQIHKWVEQFGLHSACLYGGVEKRKQEWGLAKGVDVVIGCPGRIIDFMEQGTISLQRTTFVVIDEADRMLDMGFEPQVRKIIESTRIDRQTVFFSATWPIAVRDLAFDFCQQDAVHIQVGIADITVNKDIKQIIYVLDNEDEKIDELFAILETLEPDSKVLIFSQTKKDCEYLSRLLTKEGYYAMSLHGDKTQQERDYVMNELRQSRTRIVVATDVAQRGLDVRDITHVINYNFPKQIEDYVHRIGRTGRAGDSGESISFIVNGQEDINLIKALVSILKRCQQNVPQELLTGGRQKRQKQAPSNNKRSYNNDNHQNNINPPRQQSHITPNVNNQRSQQQYSQFQTENKKPLQSQQYSQQPIKQDNGIRSAQDSNWKTNNSQPQQFSKPNYNNTNDQAQRQPPIKTNEESKDPAKKPVFGFFNSKK